MSYENALKMPFLFLNSTTKKYVAMFAVFDYAPYPSGWMQDDSLQEKDGVYRADVDMVDREKDQKEFDTEEEALLWIYEKCAEQLVTRGLENKSEVARALKENVESFSMEDDDLHAKDFEMKLDN